MTPKFIFDWYLSVREAFLCHLLTMNKSNKTLVSLLEFVKDYNRYFPLYKAKVRDVLFEMDWCRLEKKHQDQVFDLVERTLFHNVQSSRGSEWQHWIMSCRKIDRIIDVMRPNTSYAISEAFKNGKLDGISKDDNDFLLGCFRQAYGEMLEKIELNDRKNVQILMEFGALDQLLGTCKSSTKLLQRLAKHKQERPYALTTITDEDGNDAPIHGIGSPHGVSVTIYYNSESSIPVQISSAGITGDPTLNSQIFTSMFAAALTCDGEPTFVMSGGCTLSLGAQYQYKGTTTTPPKRFLSAAVGPGGPVEPGPYAPVLGEDIESTLDLVLGLLRQFQESTGLVQVIRWSIKDAIEVEDRISQKIGDLENARVHLIKSDPVLSENTGVVHVMPLLHRDENCKVVPIEIEITYNTLGPLNVYNLLCSVRGAYMQQLIAAGRRREVMARRVFQEQDQAVKQWQSKPQDEKDKICKQYPFVTITHMYDFELGLLRLVDPPEQVDRRKYEEENRPRIRDDASQYAAKFAELCIKLEQLNKEGGNADVLTFKLLFDSMVRQAPLSIPYPEIQEEYKRWVQSCSIPIWNALEDWAKRRGLSPRTLASDNVFFDARLEKNRQAVLVRPLVAFDLHDFVARIDCRSGLMEIFSPSMTPTLAEVFIPDPNHDIKDLNSLHDEFCSWVSRTLNLHDARKEQENTAKSGIFKDRRIAALVQLEQVKRLLFRGNVDQAVKIIDQIRGADLAPIYFWGAVAHQYRFISQVFGLGGHTLFHRLPTGVEQDDENNRLLHTAINMLIQSMKKDHPLPARIHLNEEAKDLLRQLQSRDESFVHGLMSPNLNINELEKASLKMSMDEEQRFRAAIFGLTALELLELAEVMKHYASTLSFKGSGAEQVQRVMDFIVEKENALSFQTSSYAQQIEDLAERVKKVI